jgi:hypothetical protein
MNDEAAHVVSPALPHEELARRMVRPVDVRVAVHARSAEHPVALVGGDLVLVVERRRMLVAMWQRWQSIGMRTTSMRSFDEPCGSWQVAQFSRTGACSNSIGPRISV